MSVTKLCLSPAPSDIQPGHIHLEEQGSPKLPVVLLYLLYWYRYSLVIDYSLTHSGVIGDNTVLFLFSASVWFNHSFTGRVCCDTHRLDTDSLSVLDLGKNGFY